MIKEYIQENRDSIVSTLKEVLHIESVKGHPVAGGPFGSGPLEALSYVLQLAESYGLQTRNLDGYAGYVEYGGDKNDNSYIAVVSHLDIVPPGSGWLHPPYAAEIVDDTIYARGAIDDKGPSMSALWALICLKTLDIPIQTKIRVIFGLDEESNWKCMEHYFRYEPKPIAGFTPDATFPLIYAEKGLATLRIDVPADADSMSLKVIAFSGGDRYNMVPNHATATVDCHSSTAASEYVTKLKKAAKDAKLSATVEANENFVEIFVQGVSAHASRPGDGINAIYYLAQLLGTGTVSNSSMWRTIGAWDTNGRALGIDAEDEISGPLTANLGKAELSNDVFQFYVNIRYPIHSKIDELVNSVQAYLFDKWRVSLIEHMPPLFVDPDSQLVKILMDVYGEFFDDNLQPITTGGATYARAIPNAVAFGARRPESEDTAHKIDECWSLSEFFNCIEIYAEAMTRLSNTL